jgi:hypothetical protein
MKWTLFFAVALITAQIASTAQATALGKAGYGEPDATDAFSGISDDRNFEAKRTRTTYDVRIKIEKMVTSAESSVLTSYSDARENRATRKDRPKGKASAKTPKSGAPYVDYASEFEKQRTKDFMNGSYESCSATQSCDEKRDAWMEQAKVGGREIYTPPSKNTSGSAPVPEPTAALIFGLGTVVMGSVITSKQS